MTKYELGFLEAFCVSLQRPVRLTIVRIPEDLTVENSSRGAIVDWNYRLLYSYSSSSSISSSSLIIILIRTWTSINFHVDCSFYLRTLKRYWIYQKIPLSDYFYDHWRGTHLLCWKSLLTTNFSSPKEKNKSSIILEWAN